MYIKYTHIPQSIGYLVEAKVYLATHLVALDSFTVDLSFDPTTQFLEHVRIHPQLIVAGFNPKTLIDEAAGNIQVHCGSDRGFVTGAEEVVVATITYRTLRVDSQLSLNRGTTIRIHSGSALGVITLEPEQQPQSTVLTIL